MPGNHERNCQTFSARFLQFNTNKEFRASNKNKEECLSRLQATNLENTLPTKKWPDDIDPMKEKEIIMTI